MGACDELQNAIRTKTVRLTEALAKQSRALAEDIRERAKDINPDIDTSGPDPWVGVDFDIEWERTEFSLDLPEVTIKDQTWSLDLPQVTMTNRDIIFHLPSVRMKTVKTGEYPETVCRMVTREIGFGVRIDVPECTIRWSPIYIDIPEPFLEEHRIVLGVPEFMMSRVEFVIGVPEFTMKTQRFALHLPRFVVKNITVEARKAEEQGQALSKESQARSARLKEDFKANAQLELGHDVTALFDCYQQDLMTKKNDALQRFNEGVALVQSGIAAMAASKVPDDNPQLAQMKTALSDLQARREAFAVDIEKKFIDLGNQQKQFFDRLIGQA